MSPFNLGQEGCNLFLNNWNTNQTVYVKGTVFDCMFSRMLTVIKQRNPTVEIVKLDRPPCGLEKNTMLTNMKELVKRGYLFSNYVNELRLQLRYAVLALLSENRVSLFNESIIDLMDNLLKRSWNVSENTANWGAFVIDKMHFELDPLARPHEDLLALFRKME